MRRQLHQLAAALSLSVVGVANAGRTIREAIKGGSLSPAFEEVASINGIDLLPSEGRQLTDAVIAKLRGLGVPELEHFIFADSSSPATQRRDDLADSGCKTYPGDPSWPSDELWDLFDTLSGGALIETVPQAAICYDNWGIRDVEKCDNLTANFSDSFLRIEDPTAINSVLYQGMTCLPPGMTTKFVSDPPTCTLGGYPPYSVKVTDAYQAQLAVNLARALNLRLVIKNTGHDFGGKSTGMGALNVWTHHLKHYKFYGKYEAVNYTGPAFKLGAGIQAFEAYQLAKDYNVTVVGGEGKTVGLMGGYFQGGGHSPLTSKWGMGADQVLALEVVTADGRFRTATATENEELFWAIRGGGGSTYGVVTSVVYKAHPQIPISTLAFSITTGPTTNITADQFFGALREYFIRFEGYADKGHYSYFFVLPAGDGQYSFRMSSWVAPNTTMDELKAEVAPLLEAMAAHGVVFETDFKGWDNFHDGWEYGFPLEAWGTGNVRQGSRLFPRKNWHDEKLLNDTWEAVRSVAEAGSIIIAFNIRNPPEYPDNAVNPAWRDVLCHCIMGSAWSYGTSEEEASQRSWTVTHDWMPRWIKVSPGSGAYMSESDYMEPDWQQSFHGSNYPRLYALKQKWDPFSVFYAQNAVGSEDWEMSGSIVGVPSQNSKLCRKPRS